MPFEVTPVALRLTRYTTPAAATPAAAPPSAAPAQ
jgi:hypothetical protein